MNERLALRCWSMLCAVLFCAVWPSSTLYAQALEDIEISGVGGQTDISVQFAAQVRYQRHVVDTSRQSVQIFLEVTGETEVNAAFEDTRSQPASAELPAFVVRYMTAPGSAASRRLDLNFEAPVEFVRVGPGADNRMLVVSLKTSTPPAAVAAGAPPVSIASSGDPAAQLQSAQEALDRQDYDTAIAVLNQILNLPPNAASQTAQELIGQVRAALGDNDRARAEFQLYLKLYPEGEGAERVQMHLAELDLPKAQGSAGRSAREVMTWGSISNFYYGGNSRIRTDNIIVTPATNSTVIDTQTLSQTDQSALVTSLDGNLRLRSGDWDSRFVLRDISTLSFLPDQPNENRLTSLYGDFKYQPQQLSARLGRQSSNSGSVLGRFDGGSFSWGLSPKWRLGAIAGRPAQEVLGNRPIFSALTADWDTPVEGLGVGLFAVRQTVDGLTDREAVGTELHYFKDTISVFSLLDYDLQFGQLNVGSVQGSWTWGSPGGTINFLYDYRRTPTLQVSNALLTEPALTLAELLRTRTAADLERQALGLTPISRVLLLGSTFPVSEHWQLGAEFRLSSLTGTEAFGDLPAMPGTGDVLTGTVQAIGNGVFGDNGVLTFTASRLEADAYEAWLAAANARFRFGSRWSLEPAVRWYHQTNTAGSTLTRIAPNVRLMFQWYEHLSLEAEISAERLRTDTALVSEVDNILFYYLGLRWDF